jgi:MFS family permease
MFFIGLVIGSFMAPQMINCFGQKKLVVARLIILGLLDLILLLMPKSSDLEWSVNALFAILFIVGVVNFIGLIAGYQLFCDYAPERRHPIMGTLWQIGEGMCTVICSIYYWKISKNWTYLMMIVTCLYFIFAVFSMLILVDSPKRFYANKKYAECYDCLKYMGKYNGCGPQPKVLKLIAHKDVLSKRLSQKEVDDAGAIETAKNDQGW